MAVAPRVSLSQDLWSPDSGIALPPWGGAPSPLKFCPFLVTARPKGPDGAKKTLSPAQIPFLPGSPPAPKPGNGPRPKPPTPPRNPAGIPKGASPPRFYGVFLGPPPGVYFGRAPKI
ncbi:U1 small nuclear ribonucleoprotein C-like [Penaeus monodon]|uniref:U1 small nuclear ribonucleoprotein C-like n=1 Tax=Penaeus monodon TaxID=6687 RepID=UPI0018A7CB7B|nr:U1 small nuclear ribonucleoprotein C-like [Penaeus monodon]